MSLRARTYSRLPISIGGYCCVIFGHSFIFIRLAVGDWWLANGDSRLATQSHREIEIEASAAFKSFFVVVFCSAFEKHAFRHKQNKIALDLFDTGASTLHSLYGWLIEALIALHSISTSEFAFVTVGCCVRRWQEFHWFECAKFVSAQIDAFVAIEILHHRIGEIVGKIEQRRSNGQRANIVTNHKTRKSIGHWPRSKIIASGGRMLDSEL